MGDRGAEQKNNTGEKTVRMNAGATRWIRIPLQRNPLKWADGKPSPSRGGSCSHVESPRLNLQCSERKKATGAGAKMRGTKAGREHRGNMRKSKESE